MLTIVARIQVKPEYLEPVKASMLDNITPTRAEAGCINYDLHQDSNDPCLFLFYENWETREHWLAHMETAHLQRHREVTKDMMASVEILEMATIRPAS